MTFKPRTRVHRLPMSDPSDVSSIETLIQTGEIDPNDLVAVLGKTEGNGCVNDFTRGFAVYALEVMLRKYVAESVLDDICFIMSGGTEGALSPHWLVFERINDDQVMSHDFEKSLAIGRYTTKPLSPSDVGRMAQVDIVAQGVKKAIERAKIDDFDDVHFVQIKCPLLTAARIDLVGGPDQVATTDTLKSMSISRGASALGVGIALGELDRAQISDRDIDVSRELYSTRASCSAGVELMACEILVVGMSSHWQGSLAIDHAVMEDMIDMSPIYGLMKRIFGDFSGRLSKEQRSSLKGMLAKAEASKSGKVRGLRHTMLDDNDISDSRHARGFIGGLLAGVIGQTDLFVSAGAEHQGPDGGGPCAIIFDRDVDD